MQEAGLDFSDPLTRDTFDAFYDRPSDTVYLNLSSEWPADFRDWDAYVKHYVVPLLVHEHLHGTLYRLEIASDLHHWAVTRLEEN